MENTNMELEEVTGKDCEQTGKEVGEGCNDDGMETCDSGEGHAHEKMEKTFMESRERKPGGDKKVVEETTQIEGTPKNELAAALVRNFKPNFIFLIETLCTGSITDCISLLVTLVNDRVTFIRRTANSVAHTLVRAANSFSGCHSWDFIPPDCTFAALAGDFY